MDLDFTREKRKLEIEDLCEELLENILVRIPLKPRTRFKCVCKNWCRSITNLRKSKPPTTSSGLVVINGEGYFDPPREFTGSLLSVQDQFGKEEECILQRSFKVDVIKPWLKASFRGLLLYHARCSSSRLEFYVSSPLRRDHDHHCIPLHPLTQDYYSSVRVGIFPHHQYPTKTDQFNVIWFDMDPHYFEGGTIDCHILSSDTMEWRNHCVPLYNGSFYFTVEPVYRHKNPLCVYNNGKLYWLHCHQFGWPLMLVYNIDHQFLKFVVLPNVKQGCRYDLLYVSEGCLFYCESTREYGLKIWEYLDDEGDGNNGNDYEDGEYNDGAKKNMDQQLKWRITHRMTSFDLIKQTGDDVRTSSFIGVPVAFNEDLQILYLHTKFIIWAYSIETRQITMVWKSGLPYLPNCIQSFDFSPLSTE